MRKIVVAVVAFALAAVACSNNDQPETAPSSAGPSTSSAGAPADPAACAQGGDIPYIEDGSLTIGTDNPAFQPWFAGTGTYGPWEADPANGAGNPASGQGFESAVAYAVADQLGFSEDEVTWVPVRFNESFKPGDKSFDLDINEISYSSQRASVVGFSDGYYDVSQALVTTKGSSVDSATTFADLKGAALGAQIGTTSYDYIKSNIQPDQDTKVYDTSVDVISALNAGQIDGFLTDAPTAYVNVLIGQVKDGVVVGQLPALGTQEYFGAVFQKDNPLVGCVNQAIAALRSDGTLSSLQKRWLKDVTFPEISQ